MTKGPIVIVEDDPDDQELYHQIITEMGLPNQLRFFDRAMPALEYLRTTPEQPFIILSDINMPMMDGLEFKTVIQSEPYLQQKGIPFVFISTNATAPVIRRAHVLNVQGYFEKPNSIFELREVLKLLFAYWERCRHINNI